MTDTWFKPKAYGYGAAPSNWKGWAATAAFVAVILGATLVLLALQPEAGNGPTAWQIGAWLLGVAAIAGPITAWHYGHKPPTTVRLVPGVDPGSQDLMRPAGTEISFIVTMDPPDPLELQEGRPQ